MFTYKTNDPRGWCGDPKRGAALGRRDIMDADKELPITLYVGRVYIDYQGYDSNGTYWGTGRPLYWVHDSEGEVDYCLRADDREHAKILVKKDYPNARFLR